MKPSAELVKQFFDDGFLIVDNVFTRRELQPAMDEIAEIVDEYAEKLYRAGKIRDKHDGEGFYERVASLEREWPGTAPLIHNKEQIRPRVAELWASDRVLDIVQEFIGPDISGHPVSCIRTKTPNTPLMDAPWHQDAATLVAAGDRTLRPTLWLPFIDATAANGCLQLIRGGHRAQKVFPHHQQRRIGHAKSWYLYIGEDDLPEGEVVTCEVPMGGALFFTPLMPHRSLENTSDKVRWSVDLRYQRPDDHMGFAEGAETGGLVPLRKKDDPLYRFDWNAWRGGSQKGEDGYLIYNQSDPFDFFIDGDFMVRWEEPQA